ncbi:hypothetical protein IAT38_002372 [Cryptococcus sp. DSM 104549]
MSTVATAPKRKRTSDDDDYDASSAAPAPTPTGTYTLAQLLELPHADLADLALSLQTQVKQAKKVASAKPAPPAAPVWTQEKIDAAVPVTIDMAHKGIKKQMKWAQSCKKGTAKWSYEGVVGNEDVFCKAFGFEKPENKKKAWKLRQVPVSEFIERVGYIDAPLTGENVRVNWNNETLLFKFSGSYGL